MVTASRQLLFKRDETQLLLQFETVKTRWMDANGWRVCGPEGGAWGRGGDPPPLPRPQLQGNEPRLFTYLASSPVSRLSWDTMRLIMTRKIIAARMTTAFDLRPRGWGGRFTERERENLQANQSSSSRLVVWPQESVNGG